MARTGARIVIPKNADELIKLAEDIYAKAQSDPDSPLKSLPMATLREQTQAAEVANDRSKQLQRQAELATSERDAALGTDRSTPGTVNYLITQSRDLLLAMYKDDPRKLGEYGFDVVESVAKKDEAPKG
jgi:hypothetical protein